MFKEGKDTTNEQIKLNKSRSSQCLRSIFRKTPTYPTGNDQVGCLLWFGSIKFRQSPFLVLLRDLFPAHCAFCAGAVPVALSTADSVSDSKSSFLSPFSENQCGRISRSRNRGNISVRHILHLQANQMATCCLGSQVQCLGNLYASSSFLRWGLLVGLQRYMGHLTDIGGLPHISNNISMYFVQGHRRSRPYIKN